MNKKMMITLSFAVFLTMFLFTIHVSLQSNLFEVFFDLMEIPWFQATLLDFYLNQYMIVAVIAYIERSWMKSLFWLIFCTCFGSMGTAIYLIFFIVKGRGSTHVRQLIK